MISTREVKRIERALREAEEMTRPDNAHYPEDHEPDLDSPLSRKRAKARARVLSEQRRKDRSFWITMTVVIAAFSVAGYFFWAHTLRVVGSG